MFKITYYDKQLWRMVEETFQSERQAKDVLAYRRRTTDKFATMEEVKDEQ